MFLFWTGVGISGTGIVVEMFSLLNNNIAGVLVGLTSALVGIILSWTQTEGVV